MAQSKGAGAVESYLVAYNLASFVGWAYVLMQTVLYLLENGTNLDGIFDRVGYAVIYVQTGAVLEVVHSLVGFVRSGFITAIMQVYSRLLLVWGILYLFDKPEVRASYGLVLMILAWSVTECVRYSHYALTLLGVEVPVLLYLRYTLFYVLYPAGVTGELLELWAALPYAAAIRPTFKAFLLLNMVNYPPVLYKLYTHMIRQRRKVLGGNSAKPTAAGAARQPAAIKKKI
ncbi:PTPLA-domain-containing protein [Martensiomyces pterosporus]|nr:PTPLA-domain-containing protein [Martensiomyces pterosporus]